MPIDMDRMKRMASNGYVSGAYVTDLVEEVERLQAALVNIAQYDPRWTGVHVNDAPHRMQLIERAFDALGA